MVLLGAPLACAAGAGAQQVTRADYERAAALRDRYQYAAVGVPDAPTWIGQGTRFCYRRSTAGGHEFVVVDAATLEKRPAFGHTRLAVTLARTLGSSVTANRLLAQRPLDWNR
jgi:hypothetical protein